MTTPGPWTIIDREDRDVEVRGLDTVVVSIPRDEYTLDDARLIAAAPQLLAACKAVLEWNDTDHKCSQRSDEYPPCNECPTCQCRRAVAEAEGENV